MTGQWILGRSVDGDQVGLLPTGRWQGGVRGLSQESQMGVQNLAVVRVGDVTEIVLVQLAQLPTHVREATGVHVLKTVLADGPFQPLFHVFPIPEGWVSRYNDGLVRLPVGQVLNVVVVEGSLIVPVLVRLLLTLLILSSRWSTTSRISLWLSAGVGGTAIVVVVSVTVSLGHLLRASVSLDVVVSGRRG